MKIYQKLTIREIKSLLPIFSKCYLYKSKGNNLFLGLFLLGGLFGANTCCAIPLDQLINQSLESYPSILAKKSSLEAAKSDLTSSKLQFLPSLNVSNQRNAVSYDNQGDSQYLPATTFSITQPLFTGGSLIAGFKKAKSNLSAADFALLETREDISKRVINVYAEWLKSHLKVQALEQSVTLHQKFVDLIINRTEAGVTSNADRDLAFSRLFQAKADLETQKSIRKTSLFSLSELVGTNLTNTDLINDISKPIKIPSRADGIQTLLNFSPTVQKMQFEAKAAEALADQTRGQALPQVSFQALRQIGNAYTPGWPAYNSYGLVVQFTPGNGFSSITNASAAYERAKSSEIQIETAKREVRDRLNSDFNEYEFSLLKKENLERSAELAINISDSYDRQYLVGRKSWLDLMNAIREQAQNLMALADANAGMLGSSYRIAVSTKSIELIASKDPE
jgi:adhesin transport system outer membrane protein